MQRRSFITLLGGAAAAWPLAAGAQQAKVPVVGYLRSTSRATSAGNEAAFHQGLASVGFAEGRNAAFDYRYAEFQNDRLSEQAADLVRRQVALIYAADNSSAIA